MHICIPDTREVKPDNGSTYLLYNVHIDGLYHCSLRFKQMLHLHQALSKKFNSSSTAALNHPLPSFPPKKLLPLSASKVEERRQQLEKYLQNISQDKTIANSTIFNMFLLEAQRESTKLIEPEKHVHLDIELVNGQKIRLPIVTHDSVDSVLTACCRTLGLADRYHAYFCLCLCGYDVVRDKLIIKRKLSFFEAPFITLQMAIQQQEQLQSVLASSTAITDGANNNINNNINNSHIPFTNLSSSSSLESNDINMNNNFDLNTCRCLSCSSKQITSRDGDMTNSSSLSMDQATYNGLQQQQQQRASSANTTYNNQQQFRRNENGTGVRNQPMWQSSTTNHLNTQTLSRNAGSLTSASPFVTHRILLRKSYWDPIYDSYILNDHQALDLLFIQTVYDMKHSLMFVDRDTYHKLESFLATDSKLEYILLARTLKYYNYVHFEPCYSDYPRPRTKVMISIGSKELNMRVLKTNKSIDLSRTTHQFDSSNSQQINNNHDPVLYCTSSLVPSGYSNLITKDDLIEEEYNFKVPLIRCWRLTSLETLNSNNQKQQHYHRPTATTTLAGGKRKSLSLFNSVVGNSNSSSPPRSKLNQTSGSASSTSNHLQGFGGQSLMASLISNSDAQSNTYQQQQPQISSTGHTDSFFNYTVNHNSSNNDHFCRIGNLNSLNRGDQDHFCQHEYHSCDLSSVSLQSQGQSSTGEIAADQTQISQYELSFEYLVAKDTLKWITISSDQAIFISISLQGVVDELVSKRELGEGVAFEAGGNITEPSPTPSQVSRPIAIQPQQLLHQQQHQNGNNDRSQKLAESFTYMCRDGGQKLIRAKSQPLLDRFRVGNSPPSLASNYSLAAAPAMAQNHRLATTGGGSGSFISPPQRRNSSCYFWPAGSSQDTTTNSPPGRSYQYHTNNHYNSVGSFDISQSNKNNKAPSPIINDAFEGVVTNDDDL